MCFANATIVAMMEAIAFHASVRNDIFSTSFSIFLTFYYDDSCIANISVYGYMPVLITVRWKDSECCFDSCIATDPLMVVYYAKGYVLSFAEVSEKK
jgi:hypothetical protein